MELKLGKGRRGMKPGGEQNSESVAQLLIIGVVGVGVLEGNDLAV